MKQFKFFIFLLFFSSELFCQYIVSHQYPYPPCKRIHGIQFTSPSSAYAVGSSGLVIKTTNGGDDWNQLSFDPATDLSGLYFVDSLVGFVHDNVSLFATTDGGDTWEHRTIIGNGYISNCFFVDQYYGWVIFSNGLYKTTDGGFNWQITMGNAADYQGKIKFFNRNSGLVIISGGLFKTVNGGQDWVRISSLFYIRDTYILDSLSIFYIGVDNSNHLGLCITTDGGYTWKNKKDSYLDNVHLKFFSPSVGVVADVSGKIRTTLDTGNTWRVFQGQTLQLMASDAFELSNLWVAGDKGILYRSVDTGRTWIPTTPTHETIRSLCVIDSLNMHGVGNKGTYLRTTDGGINWYLMPPLGNSTVYNYNKVFFIDNMVGFTVGTNGTILKTTNGGRTWNWMNSGSGDELWDIYFVDTAYGFAVGNGGKILKTTNGGVTWSIRNSSINKKIYYVYAMNKDTVSVGGQINLYSVDGGDTWKSYPPDQYSLIGVSYFDKKNGYGTTSNGIIYKTTTGGTSWTRHIYSASNASLMSFFDTLNGVTIATWPDNTPLHEIYRTSDGGRTWRILKKQAEASVYAVKMINKNEFIFVGQGASIIKVTDTPIPLFIDEDNTIKKVTGLLNSSHPNPFSTFTTIKYSLSTPCFVMLKVYDALGREVCTLIEQEQQPGEHSAVFQGKDKAAGIYFYKLFAGKKTITGKMLMVK